MLDSYSTLEYREKLYSELHVSLKGYCYFNVCNMCAIFHCLN